jgi:hypothetical protein
MCAKHYRATNLYGHPDGGNTKSNEAHNYFNDVVLKYTGDECLIWPYGRQTSGKAQVRHEGKLAYVHRLICEDAHGPPPTEKHIAIFTCENLDGGCVAKMHVRWGLTPRKRKINRNLKLSATDVENIRMLTGTMTQHDLAEKFEVSQSHISLIQRNMRLGKIS